MVRDSSMPTSRRNLNEHPIQYVQMSIKERKYTSRVMWSSNIFDFCGSVAYCGTK
jgi:hypothetical protein